MAVNIVSTPSVGTFYRNKPFDYAFSFTTPISTDASLYFGNSTPRVKPYVSGTHFKSTTGVPTTGSLGTLSVDVMMSNLEYVTTATPQSYIAAGGSCADPAGNIYFTNANLNRVYVIDAGTGTVSTFAGTGDVGGADGYRLSAQFKYPAAIITDGSGTFYVTDSYRVRKIDPTGMVSTIAGGPIQSYADGYKTSAKFWGPGPMVLQPNGDLFVVESDYHVIRNVTASGLVTTVAGLPIAANPAFAGYADGTLNTNTIVSRNGIRVVSGGGGSGAIYDTSDGATWTATSNAFPSGSFGINCLCSNAMTGTVLYGGFSNSTYGGSIAIQSNAGGLRGVTGTTSFIAVNSIATDGSLYVAGGSIVAGTMYYSTNGGFTWSTAASPGTNLLGTCTKVAYANNIYIAIGIGYDSGGGPSVSNLMRSTNGVNWTRSATCTIPTKKDIVYGNGLWVVGGTSNASNQTLSFSADNGVTWSYKQLTGVSTVSNVLYGNGLWVAGVGGGTYYVSTDACAWTQKTTTVDPTFYSSNLGTWLGVSNTTVYTSPDPTTGTWTSYGTYPQSYTIKGVADVYDVSVTPTYGTARMAFPYGMVYDASIQSHYLADQYNNRIRTFTSNGVSNGVGTFAGNGGTIVSNGTLTTAGIVRPTSIAFDSNKTMYIGSFEGSYFMTIRGSNVSVYAGKPYVKGYADGKPLNSLFNGPASITFFKNSMYIPEVYNGCVRRITTFSDVRPGLAPTGYTIVSTSNYPITVNSRIDVCWTAVGGSIPLYKYEPFCNSFTVVGGADVSDTLVYSNSSTELASYLTGTGTSNVLFRSGNGATTSYPYTLSLAVQALSNGAVVDDVSASVTIAPARITYSPCNANLVFYRNEPSSNPVFSLVSSPAQQVYAATALPTGLRFVKTGASSFTLTGTPTVQSVASNYTILGQDTSGRTYATQVSMTVNPERLILDVCGTLNTTAITSNLPIQPITITSRFPPYGADRAVTYSWYPPPPAGLQFVRSDGYPVSGLSATVNSLDPSFTLTLRGTVTAEQIQAYAAAGVQSASLVFTGVRTNGGGALSPSLPKTFTFSFAETIFFGSNSNAARLYVGLPVSNLYFSARTTFPSPTDTSITSITVAEGFIPDGLDASFTLSTQRFSFRGTPTIAGSYPFTLQATNGANTTLGLPVVFTTSNDVATITSSVADTCFTFIQYRPLSNAKTGYYPAPISYTVGSRSGCNAVLTGANLPAGVELVQTSSTSYDLSGVPSTSTGANTATLTATVSATGASTPRTFAYSVSADFVTFKDVSFAFTQNVPMTTVTIDASTFSEQPVIRFSSPSIPQALQIANTGDVFGTVVGSNGGAFEVTAYTASSSGAKTFPFTVIPDRVLLQPTVYRTVTAPGCNVSIPITGYSLSALTVSNYRITEASTYGLSINSTTGLLSGTLSSSMPASAPLTLVGSAGIVDGSLGGTITTTNLTVNRAQALRLEDGSNLSIYSSDTNGLTWNQVGPTYSNTTALTIGTNGSTVYLIPLTGGTVLKSTDGASYRSISFTGNSPYMTAIVNKPGTSTWWMAGTVLGTTERFVYLYTSTDDGETWGTGVLVDPFTDRGGNVDPYVPTYQAYLNGGVALAYKDGVLLIGGDRILRSTNEGASWSSVASGLIEVSSFSLDQQDVWIATGSTGYQTRSAGGAGPTPASTIQYSTDMGITWTNASAFSMFAYDVQYGQGQWIATGVDFTGVGNAIEVRARMSLDGVTWTQETGIPAVGYSLFDKSIVPLPISTAFDETEWVVLRAPNNATVTRYAHPYNTPFGGGWSSQVITSAFDPAPTSTTTFVGYNAQTIDPGTDITTISFPYPNTGPTFISPAQTTFVLWQYMPVPTITFLAPGATAYFVSALPTGLVWDPVAHTITGACTEIGTQSFTVYAQNSGLTALVITLNVEVPRIVKQQTGAGAYTSLLRQYTEVNAAQKARDTRAFPTQVSGIGEFASPYPPAVVTPSNCPC